MCHKHAACFILHYSAQVRILSDTWIRWWAEPDRFKFYPSGSYKNYFNPDPKFESLEKANQVGTGGYVGR